MGIVAGQMKLAFDELNRSMNALGKEVNAEHLGEIVKQHAITGALAGAGAAVLPGAGAVIATGAAAASILTMYVRISNELGVTFEDGALRALVSGVVADLSATVITNVALAAAISFLPGFGQAGASVLSMIGNFTLVYVAAYIFIKMLSGLLAADRDVSAMTAEELKNYADEIRSEINMKDIVKEAKQQYKESK